MVFGALDPFKKQLLFGKLRLESTNRSSSQLQNQETCREGMFKKTVMFHCFMPNFHPN